ncbi:MULTISPECIES: hypothetical protein [unclassified Sphingopyxis]|uniref:hypothetical protein n=1 Tax=unclassified Sphingopyxis TaxID=2614943 RepID=UPI003012BEB7
MHEALLSNKYARACRTARPRAKCDVARPCNGRGEPTSSLLKKGAMVEKRKLVMRSGASRLART